MRICSIHDCGKPHYAHDLCTMHHRRMKLYGDPLKTKRIANGEARAFIFDVALAHRGDDCLPWPYSGNNESRPSQRFRGSYMSVARIICILANGEPPSAEHHAAHSCGNGVCANPNHIRWATPSENQYDRIEHGTSNRGARNGNSVLTEAMVREIKERAYSIPQRVLAEKFGVSIATISSIVRGKNWGWVEVGRPAERERASEYLTSKIPAAEAA